MNVHAYAMRTIGANMIRTISLEKVLPNPEQPRTEFDPKDLEGLAQSIAENGVILPIAVEKDGENYILIDGERRLRAAKLAGLTDIPAHVIPSSNEKGKSERLIRAVVANIQRKDMNPIDEANAYARLKNEMGLSVIAIARRLGTYRVRIDNRLCLLDLDQEIQQLIASGDLVRDASVARALLRIPDDAARVKLARSLANRKATIKTCLSAASTLLYHLSVDRKYDGEPAIKAAFRSGLQENRTKWDALAQIGEVPPWEIVEEATRVACKACVLADMANETICGECPATHLVRTMIEKAGRK